MRRKIIAGNWKMNETPSEAVKLIEAIKPMVKDADAEVVFCVPSIDLMLAVNLTVDTNIKIGAQNMFYEECGAYTGEISPAMLEDVGVRYVIIGHSERRAYFNETDEIVNKKVIKAIEHNLTPIICCGETLGQRENYVTLIVVKSQIENAFRNIVAEDAAKCVIAYEPVWAIGTGKVATSQQAEEVCGYIRKCISEIYNEDTAQKIRIQYGGSVKPENAKDILEQPNIDGALVGGASLKVLDFSNIINYN